MSRKLVDTLHAVRPPLTWCYPIALQFTQPMGYWVRVHAGCKLPEVLHGIRSNRAQRGAA